MKSLSCFARSTQSGQTRAATARATASGAGSRNAPETVMPSGMFVSGSIITVMTVAGVKPKVRLHR